MIDNVTVIPEPSTALAITARQLLNLTPTKIGLEMDSAEDKGRGFTLVELLVVIAIIGLTILEK